MLQFCEAEDTDAALQLVTDFAPDYPEVARHGVGLIVSMLKKAGSSQKQQKLWQMACILRDAGLFSEVKPPDLKCVLC